MSALFRSMPRMVARPAAAARPFSSTPTRPLARITVIGHLADTPEIVPTSTGREIVRYALASNSGPRDNRHTSWFRVTSFEQEGPRRDFLTSLPKGSMIYVEGEATMNTYEDAEGKTRSSLNITQRNLELLKRPQNAESAAEPAAAAGA